METMTTANCVANGLLACPEGERLIESLDWQPHPRFPGVALKHLLRGADTQGRISCHLVRVAPGCGLGEHTHESQLEVHTVLEGSGRAGVADRMHAYAPGAVALIPQGDRHFVEAGDEGLLIYATFSPALV